MTDTNLPIKDANGVIKYTAQFGAGTDIDPNIKKVVIIPHTVPANFITGSTAKIEVDTVIQLFPSAGGSLRNYLTSLLVTNSDVTVGTVVEIRDGTTTVLCRGYAAPAGGGFFCDFSVPKRGSVATAMNVYCMTSGAEVYVDGTGFTAL